MDIKHHNSHDSSALGISRLTAQGGNLEDKLHGSCSRAGGKLDGIEQDGVVCRGARLWWQDVEGGSSHDS